MTTLADREKEISKLREFLDWLFEEVFNGSPDGGEIQDKAVEMGILEKREVNPDENEDGYDYLFFPYWSSRRSE